ncbi:MAG: sigma-70 family RNA polymerase sigma factor [Deltaproteobacteria bacterium]|nr:sigma-70 family RNA polymerase sigma factor [Deltaproteobacteria bacterium]
MGDAKDTWLEPALLDAESRWPQVRFRSDETRAAFSRTLDRRSTDSRQPAAAAELLLASACAAGDEAALTAVDALLALEVARAVRPIAAELVDDVAQLVRERLFVGTPPRIADYAGDGPLGAWLRAVAVRTALNAKRPAEREEPIGSTPDQPLADPDPELALLRARYRESFRAAFAQAIAALSLRERTVLRLATLDGLSLARIGAMYRKDASTISRWLAETRQSLLAATRARLAAELGTPSSELDSLMRAADSELTVSLARLLASAKP